MNEFGQKTRVGVLPYIFGAITGAALGLAIVTTVLFLRNDGAVRADSGPNYTELAGYGNYDDNITNARMNAIVRATRNAAPAVISITASHQRRQRVYDWFWKRYYPGRMRTYSTTGSGFIFDSDGYAFTNYHVVEFATRIAVTLYDGTVTTAELVGKAPHYDLALLKLDGEHFPHAPLGDSDDLLVGEWSIAIGSPFGRYLRDTQPTVTVGVISATHRDIAQDPNATQVFNDMIQTDAAINPGNSGGPLLNALGEVIGINTAIIHGGTGANVGMGFAIPINRAKFVFNEIVEHGRVRSVWLGMVAVDITPQLAAGLKLPATSGVLIQSIYDDGPAAKAGLKPGDQLLAINGVKIDDNRHANRMVFGSGVGDDLEMTVNRHDELLTVTIELEERPSDI